MPRPRGAFFFRRAIELRMDVVAAFARGLVGLDRNAMGVGPDILSNAGNLPGDFHARLTARDLETVVPNLLCNVDGGKATNAGELVPEVPVERFEPFGKF